jgi:hypothetical protein
MMTDQDDTLDSTNELSEDEIFEDEDQLLGKGIRPMLDADMINFLRRLKSAHPEIARIRDVSEQQWRQIAQETGIPSKVLTASISALRNTSFHGGGYDKVRAERARLGL